MISPKSSRHLMASPPVSNSARFRSPGIIRRNIIGDPGFQSAQFAKKSRRSKSSDANVRDVSSNVLAGKRKLSKPNEGAIEDHLESLNYRWRLMAKNQEKMTKEEIMNNYKLLLTDHIKLEKFMSLISRDNELTRTRLESDLLDSMMLVEDLKQSLATRNVSRRSRTDPKESEERKELIKQNKKLLNELHELAKKNEKSELIIFDLKEQVELVDFQMMEVQNQKIIMEEQLEIRGQCNSVSCQTVGVSLDQKFEILMKERDCIRNNYNIVKDEYDQLIIEMRAQQEENEVLRISEENLQEELHIKSNEIKCLMKDICILEDRIKNSMDDIPPSVEHVHVNGPRSLEDETMISALDDYEESSIASDSGFDMTDNSLNVLNSGDKIGDILVDTSKILWSIIKEKDEEIIKLKNEIKGFDETPTMYKSLHEELEDATKFSINPYNHFQLSQTNVKQDFESKSNEQNTCCSCLYKLQILEKENRRWKSFVENIGKAENELLQVIADLEEAVRTYNQDSTNRQDLRYNVLPQNNANNVCHIRTAEYFSICLEDIQFGYNKDQIAALISEAERVKDDAKRQLLRLEEDLDASNLYVENLDIELTTAKKIELTLRRRIETLEQRLMTPHTGCGIGPTKSIVELETKIAQLETINSSLIEINSLEKRRMEEQMVRINELERVKMLLNEKLNDVQTKETFSQKKINRLQNIYEDLLREYSALCVPSNDRQKESINCIATVACEENKQLRTQLKTFKEKCEELQSLIIRYHRYIFTDGKVRNVKLSNALYNKSFNCQLRDFESKMNELTKSMK